MVQCFRYKYFSQLKKLNMSQEKQPLGRMLSVPSPLPSAEGTSGLGELKDLLNFNLAQSWKKKIFWPNKLPDFCLKPVNLGKNIDIWNRIQEWGQFRKMDPIPEKAEVPILEPKTPLIWASAWKSPENDALMQIWAYEFSSARGPTASSSVRRLKKFEFIPTRHLRQGKPPQSPFSITIKLERALVFRNKGRRKLCLRYRREIQISGA